MLGHKIKEDGENEGVQVLEILAHQPATARFISTELAQRFVSDDPPPALITAMSKTFLKTDGDIRAVLETMFTSQEFWAPQAYRARVKTPFEFVVSSLRATQCRHRRPATVAGRAEQDGYAAVWYAAAYGLFDQGGCLGELSGAAGSHELWADAGDEPLARHNFQSRSAVGRTAGGRCRSISDAVEAGADAGSGRHFQADARDHRGADCRPASDGPASRTLRIRPTSMSSQDCCWARRNSSVSEVSNIMSITRRAFLKKRGHGGSRHRGDPIFSDSSGLGCDRSRLQQQAAGRDLSARRRRRPEHRCASCRALPITPCGPASTFPRQQVIDLNGFFGLHPSLASFKPLWDQRQLAIVHAAGSPDTTRSHFDAQDYMESGTPGVKITSDGWLNRTLQIGVRRRHSVPRRRARHFVAAHSVPAKRRRLQSAT